MSRTGTPAAGVRATGPGGAAAAAAAAAATVLGVDLGGTKLRAALAGLDGMVLAELVEPTVRGPGEEIVAQVTVALATLQARAGVAVETIRAAGIGLPLAVDPWTGASWSFHNVPGLGRIDAAAAFRAALGVPVALENDANCAALGEGRSGAAVGVSDFVVVAIGTGIGSGIVSGDRLVRGAHGGAGEIAFLPLGTDPWDERNRALGAYETAVAGPALRARVEAALRIEGAPEPGPAGPAGRTSSRRCDPTRLWPGDPSARRPDDPTTLRPGARLADAAAAAAAGDVLAARLLDEEARLVALGIAAIAAVVDPELVVLSGGVGAVGGLLDPVRAHVATLAAQPPRIETGLLGDRATLIGAIGLALDLASGAS